MRTFGANHREEFRELVRATVLDEAVAAAEAARLATAWLEPWYADDNSADLARCLEHKVAGYNADIHQWVRRAHRASAAADKWLGVGAINVEFQLSDLRLGEYFLLQRVTARGGAIVTRTPLAELVTGVLKTNPPCTERTGYEYVEVPLRPQLEWAGTDGPPLATLFVATMANYLNPMIPVMEEMVRTGRRAGLLTPRASAQWANWDRLPAGVERLTFEDLHTRERQTRLDVESEQQIRFWRRRARVVAGSFRTSGIDLWPLVAHDIEHIGKVYIPHVRTYAQMARDLVKRRGVETVVCARLRRACECAVVQGAQAAGARCIVLIHGHISSRPERRFEDGSFDWADRVCAWGPQQSETLAAKGQGMRPEQVMLTGNPDWDLLTPPDEAARAGIRAKVAEELALDPSACWVMVATQQDSRSQFERITQAVLAQPGAQLLVRVHPRENPRSYAKAILPEHEQRVRIIGAGGAETGLHSMLAAADALVTFHSTTNIEALLLGTPVVTVALGELATIDRLAPLEPYGLPLATTREQLAQVLALIAQDPREFRRSNTLAIERAVSAIAGKRGGAASCVCGLLQSLTAEAA